MELFRGKYIIDCDSNANVTLKLNTGRTKLIKNKNTGEENEETIYDVLGYFSTYESCMKWFLGYLIKQKGRSDNQVNSVERIIEVIEESKNELLNELNKINLDSSM